MKKDEILVFQKRKKEEFKKMFHIKEIGLLSSCARGENKENSDSVILV